MCISGQKAHSWKPQTYTQPLTLGARDGGEWSNQDHVDPIEVTGRKETTVLQRHVIRGHKQS